LEKDIPRPAPFFFFPPPTLLLPTGSLFFSGSKPSRDTLPARVPALESGSFIIEGFVCCLFKVLPPHFRSHTYGHVLSGFPLVPCRISSGPENVKTAFRPPLFGRVYSRVSHTRLSQTGFLPESEGCLADALFRLVPIPPPYFPVADPCKAEARGGGMPSPGPFPPAAPALLLTWRKRFSRERWEFLDVGRAAGFRLSFHGEVLPFFLVESIFTDPLPPGAARFLL